MTDPRITARLGGPVTPLRHGRWSADVRGDEVADVRFDGVLLLRAVRPVVRDQDWNTVGVQVLAAAPGADGRRLETRLRFASAGIDYAATLIVELSDDEVRVDFAGEALRAFTRNRIGLVVLHPARDAGRPVQVHHRDGTVSSGRWPVAISPHQPFTDVTGFDWTIDGVHARLRLGGDVFETEDQRNWTDASYKTYSTPLDLPFPVSVAPGETCRQQVRLRASGRLLAPAAEDADLDVVTVSARVVAPLPPISLGAALYPPPGGDALAALARRAGRYQAVLVELVGDQAAWPELVTEAARQGDALAAALDVRLVAVDPAALERGLAVLAGRQVSRVAAFDPADHGVPGPLWTALGDGLSRHRFAALPLAGTRGHFTELNRQRDRVPTDAPALTFSLTPQMHATELPHLVDSLAAQRTVAENAVRLAEGRPVHVGPVTLTRRFNAVATGPRPDPATEAARATDPLQATGFTAAWTLGSVAALTVPGVASLGYFETVGPRGVLAADGTPTPTAEVLDALAGLRGRPVLAVSSPDGVSAVAVRTNAGIEVRLGNLTAADRRLVVRGPDGKRRSVELAAWSAGSVTLP